MGAPNLWAGNDAGGWTNGRRCRLFGGRASERLFTNHETCHKSHKIKAVTLCETSDDAHEAKQTDVN